MGRASSNRADVSEEQRPTSFGPSLDAGEVTRLLGRWRDGDEEAGAQVLHRVYPVLRRMAARTMSGESGALSLQPTELVHELYLQLAGSRQPDWADRVHFFALGAKVMRRVLILHARRRNALKRGSGARPISLEVVEEGALAMDQPDVLELDMALKRLAEADEISARLVELRYFGGLTLEEAALVLGVGRTTLVRKWRSARVWLKVALTSEPE